MHQYPIFMFQTTVVNMEVKYTSYHWAYGNGFLEMEVSPLSRSLWSNQT